MRPAVDRKPGNLKNIMEGNISKLTYPGNTVRHLLRDPIIWTHMIQNERPPQLYPHDCMILNGFTPNKYPNSYNQLITCYQTWGHQPLHQPVIGWWACLLAQPHFALRCLTKKMVNHIEVYKDKGQPPKGLTTSNNAYSDTTGLKRAISYHWHWKMVRFPSPQVKWNLYFSHLRSMSWQPTSTARCGSHLEATIEIQQIVTKPNILR